MISYVEVAAGRYSADDVRELLDYINHLEVEVEDLQFKIENPE